MELPPTPPKASPPMGLCGIAAFRVDLEKYHRIAFGDARPTLGKKLALWADHAGLHCVAVYRLGQEARSLRARRHLAWPALLAVARVASELVELVHHVHLAAPAIGPGFYIGHPSTIYIGPARIGRNFSVTHNVTIGLGQGEGSPGYPILGDDVWVGTGSVVAGAIEVGSGVTVASGTILTRSVPKGSLVGGNPGRPVRADYDNRRLHGQGG